MLPHKIIIYYFFVTMITLTGVCMNGFFAFCMYSDDQHSLKPPLLVLLATGVSHNMLLQVLIFLYTFKTTWGDEVGMVFVGLIIYSGLSCMSSNVWLSAFYYTKIVIVSSQKAAFVWIRRNIAVVAYAGLIVDKIYLIFFALSITVPRFLVATPTNDSSPANATVGLENYSLWFSIGHVFTRLHLAYLVTFIGLMMWVWGCTLIYICRHIRSMEGSSGPFSSPKLRSQIRVVAQGIVQTVLYTIVAGSQAIIIFPNFVCSDPKIREYLHNVSVVLYTLGTTINLGLSQHLFRERTVRVVTWVKSRDCWRCKKIV